MSGEHLDEVKDAMTGMILGIKYYIRPLMIHEFGHTFGLPDFYKDDQSLKDLSAIMNDPHTNMTITVEDIEQLRAIYAVHNSSDHN